MPTDPSHDAELEIGHVLFMDIVGFSKLLVDEQSQYTRQLNGIVRSTEPFRSAEAADKLFRLPTGDGMVLVFFTNPEAPVRCAVEIAKALKDSPTFGLRMGIHSGPINKISDVNDRANVAGGGINIAQRVMDCGDAGHILLSKRVAEDLEQYGRWRPHLHDLGVVEVKHGVRVELVNLHSSEAGNPALPERVRSAKQERDSAARVGTLAVKPLDNFSGDASKDYFADGMTDELITKLSQISAFRRVISRSTMMRYKGSPKSIPEIAQELDVANVLEGSVVLSGDHVRISVQLIEAATDRHLWSESYTRSVSNIISLQNEVALDIAGAIELMITPKEKARLTTTRLVNPEAYEYYLRGKNPWGKDREGIEACIAWLEKSIAIDGTFAPAYADLSTAYASKAYFLEASAREWEVKAEEASAKAIALDPELPSAWLSQSRLLWRPTTGFKHEEAIRTAQRALAAAPNSPETLFYLASIYFHVGLVDKALELYRKTDAIEPGNPTTKFNLGQTVLLQGRYEEAIPLLEASLTGMIRSVTEHCVVLALYFAGRIDEARGRLESARAQFKDIGGVLTALQALFHARDGDKQHAQEKIEEATCLGEGFGHFHHTTYIFAAACATMDEPEQAMKWLHYTAENGYPNLTLFERDPLLDKLRGDPSFVAFLENLRPRYETLKALADSP